VCTSNRLHLGPGSGGVARGARNSTTSRSPSTRTPCRCPRRPPRVGDLPVGRVQPEAGSSTRGRRRAPRPCAGRPRQARGPRAWRRGGPALDPSQAALRGGGGPAKSPGASPGPGSTGGADALGLPGVGCGRSVLVALCGPPRSSSRGEGRLGVSRFPSGRPAAASSSRGGRNPARRSAARAPTPVHGGIVGRGVRRRGKGRGGGAGRLRKLGFRPRP